MSSDAETKGGGRAASRLWCWSLALLAFFAGALFGTRLAGGADRAQEIESTAALAPAKPGGNNPREQESRAEGPRSLRAGAAGQAVARAPDLARGGNQSQACDIPRIHLGFDARHQPAADLLRKRLDHRSHATFEELYALVVNRPYDASNNIWHTFPNAYNLKPNFHFPYSNLHVAEIDKVFELLGSPVSFAVEVGSFHGHSAIWQALALDKHGFPDAPLLCIDPWTGGLGQLLNRDDWDKKITPGEIADGRSTSYWQFMLNIRYQIEQKHIGAKHIIPLAVTSIVGARYLMALGLTPDTIFLDSAHEVDETFIELSLYYEVLAEGGVIFGDDFTWDGVRIDVTRFSEQHNLQLHLTGVIWMLKKPARR